MNDVRIHLSGVYDQEGFDCGALEDLRSLEGTCCYCSEEAAATLRTLAKRCSAPVRWIDTGDYHYLSFFFIEAAARPVRLLLIDNHSDDFDYTPGELNCGNWVRAARSEGLLTESADAPLYISIDLDALCEDEFKTNWDQGSMSYAQLIARLSEVKGPVAGIDICGGITISKGASDKELERNRSLRMQLRSDIERLFF